MWICIRLTHFIFAAHPSMLFLCCCVCMKSTYSVFIFHSSDSCIDKHTAVSAVLLDFIESYDVNCSGGECRRVSDVEELKAHLFESSVLHFEACYSQEVRDWPGWPTVLHKGGESDAELLELHSSSDRSVASYSFFSNVSSSLWYNSIDIWYWLYLHDVAWNLWIPWSTMNSVYAPCGNVTVTMRWMRVKGEILPEVLLGQKIRVVMQTSKEQQKL